MAEFVKNLRSFDKYTMAAMIISDEQIDETGKKVTQPALVFSAGEAGRILERVGYIPVLELQKWIESSIPSDIMNALAKKRRQQEFGIEDYGMEYAVDQGRGMRMVRYKAWRKDRPNVPGYGKTPNDAIFDLIYNVQPLD